MKFSKLLPLWITFGIFSASPAVAQPDPAALQTKVGTYVTFFTSNFIQINNAMQSYANALAEGSAAYEAYEDEQQKILTFTNLFLHAIDTISQYPEDQWLRPSIKGMLMDYVSFLENEIETANSYYDKTRFPSLTLEERKNKATEAIAGKFDELASRSIKLNEKVQEFFVEYYIKPTSPVFCDFTRKISAAMDEDYDPYKGKVLACSVARDITGEGGDTCYTSTIVNGLGESGILVYLNDPLGIGDFGGSFSSMFEHKFIYPIAKNIPLANIPEVLTNSRAYLQQCFKYKYDYAVIAWEQKGFNIENYTAGKEKYQFVIPIAKLEGTDNNKGLLLMSSKSKSGDGYNVWWEFKVF